MLRTLLPVSLLLICPLGCNGATSANPPAEGPEASSGQPALASDPSDDQIVARIQDGILKSGVMEPQSGDVQVSSVAGAVTLRGHTGTALAKQRIHDLALHTPGVTTVANELSAPVPNPSASNDAAMTQQIQQRLQARQATNVTVKTENGTVTLEGSVITELEKVEIQKLAEQTPNVEAVENHLRVKPLNKL